MKNIKNLINITIILSFVLMISACSENSEQKSVEQDINVDINTIKDAITIQTCSNVSDDANTEILSGDILTSEDSNTTVKLTYNEDGSNYVCLVSGRAFINR